MKYLSRQEIPSVSSSIAMTFPPSFRLLLILGAISLCEAFIDIEKLKKDINDPNMNCTKLLEEMWADVKENWTRCENFTMGNAEVSVIEDLQTWNEDDLKYMSISRGDSYNLTFVLRTPSEDSLEQRPITPNYTDISSLEIRQQANDRDEHYTFMFNQTAGNNFIATAVLPTNIIPRTRRSMRALRASEAHPRYPKYTYETKLTLRNSRGEVVPLELFNILRLHAIHVAYNGAHIGEGPGVRLDIFFRLINGAYYEEEIGGTEFSSEREKSSYERMCEFLQNKIENWSEEIVNKDWEEDFHDLYSVKNNRTWLVELSKEIGLEPLPKKVAKSIEKESDY